MVRTHAVTMRPAIPQRTADNLRVAPTPRIAPEIACVVEIGMPNRVAISMTVAALVSAAKPLTGLSVVMRMPIVRVIRHAPVAVPGAVRRAAVGLYHAGAVQAEP